MENKNFPPAQTAARNGENSPEKQRQYAAIDLKSFYASVECTERGLDPLNTNLVVADESRTEKTICLAVSPSLKSFGISGRARLFEVVQRVEEVNRERRRAIRGEPFQGESSNYRELMENPYLAVSYIAARPRMSFYMEYSTRIYDIYLKYISPEDIHVYSIDEVFMDVTDYLQHAGMNAHELTMTVIRDVLRETGITATAGIGTNLYLAKIAMDIVAKHMKPDADGVRIAELNEITYRKLLWEHKPLTDFWRIGKGYEKRLSSVGLYTMGDIARCSLGGENDYYNEDLLYRLFGVNAELLIDHAWGYEPCQIRDIRNSVPENRSKSRGQVLQEPYSFEKGKLIVREMADLLALDLTKEGIVTDQIVLTVGYDIENLSTSERRRNFKGTVKADFYGREAPKNAHGSRNLGGYTASGRRIAEAFVSLYEEIVDPALLIRRMYVAANHVLPENKVPKEESFVQMDLFSFMKERDDEEKRNRNEEKEKRLQKAVVELQKKFGKNAVLKGMNLEEGATTIERNSQIGGHKA
ncbi:MAG: DNA methylase [Lachnospiraceae bacterium]|nr:DNA methylase [Lachnospiraceae bacterium]